MSLEVIGLATSGAVAVAAIVGFFVAANRVRQDRKREHERLVDELHLVFKTQLPPAASKIIMTTTSIKVGIKPIPPRPVYKEALEVLMLTVKTFVLSLYPIAFVVGQVQKKQHVSGAPGGHLLQLVDFFYSKKTVKRVFEQIVGDMREEHFEALHQGRKWKAAWVLVRGYWGFLKAMNLSWIASIVKSIKKVMFAPKGA